MPGLLLLAICALLAKVATGEFCFTVTRPTAGQDNVLTFRCDEVNGPVTNPMFFRDSQLLSTVVPTIDDGFLYRIDRSSEGNFSCGILDGNGGRRTSPSQALIAFPVDSVTPVNRGPFYGLAGSTVRLDCSITPGVLVGQYYVTWRSASDPTKVFYESFPPRFSRGPINRDIQRYSVDARNFSLYIHDVIPEDGADGYVCVLGVEDTMTSRRDLPYRQTEDVNITLLVSKPPVFTVKPQDEVAVRGDTVTFSCSTLSSPGFTIINWLHDGQLLSSGDRYSISTNASQREAGSAVTLSTLTVDGVTGFDSGPIVCRATATNADNSMTFEISTEASLNVLDVVADFNPVALETGGFLYEVGLRAALTVPVRLVLVYTTLDGDRQMNFTSTVAYSNARDINHIAPRNRVPFNLFRVKVALMYKDTMGPFFHQDNHYMRALLSDTSISLTVLVVLLVIILCIVAVILAVMCCSWFKIDEHIRMIYNPYISAKWTTWCHKSCPCLKALEDEDDEESKADVSEEGDEPKDENGGTGVRINSDSASQSSASHPRVSKNGFTPMMAKQYVKGLKEAVRFARSDKVISKELNKVFPMIVLDDDQLESVAITRSN